MMDPKRQQELTMDLDAPPLTDEEWNQGYHHCYDFDGLVIGPLDYEWMYCTCRRPEWENDPHIDTTNQGETQ